MTLIIAGELHVPLEVCGAVVKRELDYWQILETHIKSCCWRNYRTYIENQRILEAFNHSVLSEQQKTVDTESLTGWEKYRTKMWLILEYPRTSKTALVSKGSYFLYSFTMLNILGLFLYKIQTEGKPVKWLILLTSSLRC